MKNCVLGSFFPCLRRVTPVSLCAVLLLMGPVGGGIGADAEGRAAAGTTAEQWELDVDTAVALALSNNLGIRSERIDVAIAARNHAHRYNMLIPQIAAQGTLARPNAAPAFRDDPRWEQIVYPLAEAQWGGAVPTPEPEDPPRWNLSTGVSAQLTLAAQMIPGIRAVTQAYENARIDLDEAERQVELEVTKAFSQLLLLQAQLELSERRLEAALERLEEVRANYDAGFVDELTLRRTEVGVQNQRPAILRQEQGYRTAKYSLAATIGIDDPDSFTVVGEIEEAPARLVSEEELLRLAGRNADVRAVRRGIQGLETQIDLTRAEMMPTLTLGYSVNPTLSGDPWSSDLWDTDRWSDRGSFNVTVRQPLDPILPGSSTRQELANRRDQLQQTELRVRQAREAVELRARQLAGGISAAQESIDALVENVSLAKTAFELAQEAYDSGVRDYAVVRDAEIDLADARLQLLQERHRAGELLLELEYLLDTPREYLSAQS